MFRKAVKKRGLQRRVGLRHVVDHQAARVVRDKIFICNGISIVIDRVVGSLPDRAQLRCGQVADIDGANAGGTDVAIVFIQLIVNDQKLFVTCWPARMHIAQVWIGKRAQQHRGRRDGYIPNFD